VTSALDAYLHGDLDTTDPYDSIEGDMLGRVQEDTTLAKDLKTLPGLCTQYIGFDVRQRPFDDPAVRRAFAAGLNRDDLVSQVLKEGVSASWFTPPQLTAAPDLSATLGIPFDAPQAKDLLDQTGWGVGQKALPELTFGVNPNDTFIQAAVAAAQNWKAALSASVTIDSDYSDFQAYLTKLGTAPPPIFRLGYCASYPDAASFAYDVFHSGSLYNFTHWTNPAYDRLVEQAARETDALKRRALYTAAEKILIEDQAAIVPLVWTTRVSLTNSRVERSYAVMQGYDHIEYWRVSR
jgi:oligopeptide transport system substrate-binding protein